MKTHRVIYVKYHDRLVGTLAETADRRIAFEYSDEWLADSWTISPFSLPLNKGVFVPSKQIFDGLFGVFADSLPDAWGRLLVDRMLKRSGINAGDMSILDRLAIVGSSGMGALTYEPEMSLATEAEARTLDELARSCSEILKSRDNDNLDTLYALGGSSGGARPKITIEQDGVQWLVKFPAHVDSVSVGRMEYEYSECARECGIEMPDTKLFESAECDGYFGIKRFDRIGNERVHMITAAAMLEVDFNTPCLDYNSLMKLTGIVTAGNRAELEQMYRRMCFNVYAHNRDDHAKNFTFLYDEPNRMYKLSPAYNLTYSTTYYGEHTTSVDGNGSDPGLENLVSVGVKAGLPKTWCRETAEAIEHTVTSSLSEWL